GTLVILGGTFFMKGKVSVPASAGCLVPIHAAGPDVVGVVERALAFSFGSKAASIAGNSPASKPDGTSGSAANSGGMSQH
ncbi:MAG: hypothetical protein ACKPKO_15755, partial [Candidatus Fonsibacter sp.]